MRRRILIAAAAVVALLAVPLAPPANAVSWSDVQAVVTFSTSAGMGHAGLFPPVTVGFTINSVISCVDLEVNAAKPRPILVAGDRCLLTANGTLTGNCYNASGSVSGTITHSSGRTVTFSGQVDIVWDVTITGTAGSGTQTGPMRYFGTYHEDFLAGSSCNAGTAKDYFMGGRLNYLLI